MRPPGAFLGLLLLTAACLAHGNGADDLYWEGENGDEFLEVKEPAQELGIGAHVRRLRDTLLDIWESNNEKADADNDIAVKSRAKRQDDIQPDIDDITEDPRENDNDIIYDDENETEIGSGSPPGRKKEVSVQVSFVLREPYEPAFSNRDSDKFQNLSHTLADAVNALYDQVPGTQRATLVRIQSRPTDLFSCKVSMDLVSTNYFQMDHLEHTLFDHIRSTGRLNTLVVSDEEFEFQRNDVLEGEVCAETDFHCNDGKCIPSHAYCNGHYDCSDHSDEYGCDDNDVISQQEIDQEGTNPPTTVPTITMAPDSRTYTTVPPSVSVAECPENTLQCDNKRRCVPLSERCDGIAQCEDGTDELGCRGKPRSLLRARDGTEGKRVDARVAVVGRLHKVQKA